jgi:uncharacterized membrane protein
MAMYGIVLLMAAIAYFLLQTQIIRSQGENSLLARAIGNDIKGKMSPILYSLAIASNFVSQWISGGFYILVALIWLIPDKRIEIIIKSEHESIKGKK